MKIAIIGGGPAGLYAAILLKKQRPEAEITVYERNRADDTFGFGVVFSDATLDNFEKYDGPSYRRITQEFAYWDDIAVHFRGTVHRVGGNGFCGCSRRKLLLILQERARELGVALDVPSRHRGRIPGLADADLVVLADGINSRFRDKYAEHFQPEVDLRSNMFAWMGSTRPLDAFTFIFQETEWGPFIAHAYQYEMGRSTWIFETDPETFKRAGLEGLERKAIRRPHGRDLRLVPRRASAADQPLDVAQFPDDPQQALGQGQHGAARRRQGDRAFLDRLRHQARDGGRDRAGRRHAPRADRRGRRLQLYESGRREEVEKTQHAADVSLVWFEHVDRFWDFDPVQFAFGVMTRSKAITYDNLTLRAPDFVAEVDRAFAQQVRASGFDVDADKPVPPMFQPLRLREMKLANRAVVSPMCMYSAKEGVPGDFHLVHYGSRAIGGAGLIFTEMTCVSRDARITPGCAGLWNDEQEAAWRRIVDFVHANSAAKIAPAARPCRAQGRDQIDVGRHGPSAGRGRLGRDLGVADSVFSRQPGAARDGPRRDGCGARRRSSPRPQRGERCGFDMLELHCAHGYLLASFISPLTNHRTDAYGGSLDNRLRFPLEVFEALRAVWPAHKPMSVRISATDWAEGGITGDDAVEIARAFARGRRRSGRCLHRADRARRRSRSMAACSRRRFPSRSATRPRVATMCVGNITTADQVNTILAAGRADLVALGRPHLVDPSFTLKAAAWYGASDIACPPQYLPGKEQIFRNSVRDRQDFDDLKIKAKPKTRAELKSEATKPLAAE